MAYHTDQRVKLGDNTFDVLHKVSEGNPGALTVCMQLMKVGEKIDPDGFMGGMGTILSLDAQAIYGSRIWMLFKDVCGEHLGKMCGMLRAVQLGFFSGELLDVMIDNPAEGYEEVMNGLIAQVQERLPAFNLEAK